MGAAAVTDPPKDGTTFWFGRFDATEVGARSAAQAVAGQLTLRGIAADRCSDIEIATAEAVNNVVEHAYDPGHCGSLVLSLSRCGTYLCLAVFDRGRPLPCGAVPEGKAADVSGPADSLPEGGFGWFLIRTLTASISYRQNGAENHLILRFSGVFA